MADPAKKTARKAPARAPREPGAGAAPREVQPLRPRIPALSGAQASALRGVFAAPQTWTLRDNGMLQFMPGKPAPPAQCFEIDAEGTRIGLSLQQASTDAAGPHWSDYHGRSRVLAWSLAHEAQLMRLSEAFGTVLTPVAEPGDDAQDPATQLWLDFIVDEEPAAGSASRMPALQGALRVPAGWTERLLERADPPYDEAPGLPGHWRGLGVPVSLQWCVAPLPRAEFASLQPGDVIVIGIRGQPPQAEARVRGLAWPLSSAPGGWQVNGPPRHLQTVVQESFPMNDTPQDTGDDAGNASGDGEAIARQLPVDISFEVGRSELRVGELSSLQPGYVFPLAAPVEGANVTIRANGQAVGQGEVVAVGDTLGVRLLWWN